MDTRRDLRSSALRRPGEEAVGSELERLPTEAMIALQSGHRIEAIRIVREQTGVGLIEAKELVERAERQHEPRMPRRASKEDSGILRLVAILVILGAVVAAVFFL